MRNAIMTVLLGASLLSATGCATKRETGTALGATGGGALGYAVGGAPGLVIGALAGGVLGHTIGKEMDEKDRERALQAIEQDRASSWRSSNGNAYRIEPGGTRYQDGRECREFKLMADVEGKADNVNGLACRRPDGQWEAVST
jgi:surface antigen